MSSNFIPKSIKGLSIISNLNVEESFIVNTDITTQTITDIGSLNNPFDNLYVNNINISNGNLRNQFSADNPINYNSTTGNFSFLKDNNIFNTNLTSGNLELKINNVFSIDTNGLDLKINDDQLFLSTSGNLNINDNYTKNLFNGVAPISFTNGNVNLKFDTNIFSTNASTDNLQLKINDPFSISTQGLNLKLDPLYLKTSLTGNLSFSDAFLISENSQNAAILANSAAITAEETRALASETALGLSIAANTTSISIINGTLTGYLTNFSTSNLISTNFSTSNLSTSLAVVKSRLNVNTDLNTNNKILTLFDGNPGSNVVDASNFFGFGINPSVQRYQVPGNCAHRFFIGSTLIFQISNNRIDSFVPINSSHLQITNSTFINSEGLFLEWNQSAGGGESTITNQVGFGNDNSIVLAGSNQSNARTRFLKVSSNAIVHPNGGSITYDISGGSSTFLIYGRNSTDISYLWYRNNGQLLMQVSGTTSSGLDVRVPISIATGNKLFIGNAQLDGSISNFSGHVFSATNTPMVIDFFNNLYIRRITTSNQINTFQDVANFDGNLNMNLNGALIVFQRTGISVDCGFIKCQSYLGTNVQFLFDNGAAQGNISSNGSNTNYNASSDYRLKKNIKPIKNALSILKNIKPSKYTWISTEKDGYGFIAHELQEVLPECVNGKKDAIFEDGSINPQGIDYGKLTPVLASCIQELVLKNEKLEERLFALESLIKSFKKI